MIRYHGSSCKWWHFYPDEGITEMEAKYKEIIEGKAESGMLNNIVGGAKQFKKKIFADM